MPQNSGSHRWREAGGVHELAAVVHQVDAFTSCGQPMKPPMEANVLENVPVMGSMVRHTG